MLKTITLALCLTPLLFSIEANAQSNSKSKKKQIKIIEIENGDTTVNETIIDTDAITKGANELEKELKEVLKKLDEEFQSMTFNYTTDDEDGNVKADATINNRKGKSTIIISTEEKGDGKRSKTKRNSSNNKQKHVTIASSGASTTISSVDVDKNELSYDEKTNTLAIEFSLPNSGEASIQVTDAKGNKLYDKTIDGKPALYNREVELKNKPEYPLTLSVKQKGYTIVKTIDEK
jgi:hypothetical protein